MSRQTTYPRDKWFEKYTTGNAFSIVKQNDAKANTSANESTFHKPSMRENESISYDQNELATLGYRVDLKLTNKYAKKLGLSDEKQGELFDEAPPTFQNRRAALPEE